MLLIKILINITNMADINKKICNYNYNWRIL